MELLPPAPNVELRSDGDEQIVVLAFPYDASIVNVVRGIPGRRFDWDRREWWAPADDWVGVHVMGVMDRFPDLTASDDVVAWLAAIERRWIGIVSATRYDGRGWWTLSTRAGEPPAELLEGSVSARRRDAAGAAHARGCRGARGAGHAAHGRGRAALRRGAAVPAWSRRLRG